MCAPHSTIKATEKKAPYPHVIPSGGSSIGGRLCKMLALTLFLWRLSSPKCVDGFYVNPPARPVSWRTAATSTTPSFDPSSPADTSPTAASSLESAVDAALRTGENPIPLIEKLEAKEDPEAEPNRSPDFLGEWHVWWTDCPPPSNGQLGPFSGTSEQMIADASSASYQNLLRVPPNDWLMAVLDGIYEDWDGTLLEGNGHLHEAATPPVSDWGARHWKVTFSKLTISVFGFSLIEREFPPDTSRVWRTTYMDGNVRIVRAGKTGRRSDEVVFYTKRQPKP